MTADEAAELLLLRRHYGLSARDVYHALPAWEVDLLLEGLRPQVTDREPVAAKTLVAGWRAPKGLAALG